MVGQVVAVVRVTTVYNMLRVIGGDLFWRACDARKKAPKHLLGTLLRGPCGFRSVYGGKGFIHCLRLEV